MNKKLIRIFKNNVIDNNNYCIYITKLDNNKCNYKLKSIDRISGDEHIFQDVNIKFDNKFISLTLPKLYNLVINEKDYGDYSKRRNNTYFYAIHNLEEDKVIAFSKLDKEDLEKVRIK